MSNGINIAQETLLPFSAEMVKREISIKASLDLYFFTTRKCDKFNSIGLDVRNKSFGPDCILVFIVVSGSTSRQHFFLCATFPHVRGNCEKGNSGTKSRKSKKTFCFQRNFLWKVCKLVRTLLKSVWVCPKNIFFCFVCSVESRFQNVFLSHNRWESVILLY